MVLDELSAPIVLAPMAGGPSTPALAAAVSDAGGLGFVAAGYLTAESLAERLEQVERITTRPYGVNLFVPAVPSEPQCSDRYAEVLVGEARRYGVKLGRPRFDDDGWGAKLDILAARQVPVVSFTFGCPSEDVVTRMHSAGSEVWATVTTPVEAIQAIRAGADVLVAQGIEAGGHRASFADSQAADDYSVLALLQLLRDIVDVPVVAAGGIGTGAAVAAVLCAGARAAQLGTAFLGCPEAGTAQVHRDALPAATPTALTRAFTGRLARGIRNRFMAEYGGDAPIAYPEIHHVTSPLRQAGRDARDPEVVNLWAGQTHPLAQARPAGEIVRALTDEARAATSRLSGMLMPAGRW
ncbi:NAD(P)H-dependent flavin oxidoreductase [Frankia sp. Cr1]|uniref:NAD(P)H-dependent flavin oxidoreductase n=1 Tax=Frankia sp. Cr1 TaxID=3073931 RepID=UPI002AD4EB59|nr:nitronate monooxygenase [Frankia sp. Cr1]